MTNKLLNTVVLVFVSLACTSQSFKPKISVGVDLFRSMPTYFQRGYTLEPSIIYQTNKGWIFDFAAGITSIYHSRIYTNVEYKNEGNYFRFTVRRSLGGNFDIGLGFGLSNFTEYGTVVFKDQVFGNYTLDLKQSNQLIFIEPSLNYKLKISSRFTLVLQYRMPIVSTSIIEQVFPVYAAPGIGDMQLMSPGESKKSSPSTIALSVRLTYKIFKD